MEKLLVIVGPTAVGKSGVALEMAKTANGEIISADSVQVYRGLTIGAAKPTLAERQSIVHHLVDIVDPQENYTVAQFQLDASQTIIDVLSRGKLPILVGGTGLYVRAVVSGYAFSDNGENEELRARLQQEALDIGPEALHRKLAAVDPQTAVKLHPNDIRRVIRALEVYEQSQRPISEQAKKTAWSNPYETMMFGLTMPRELLYRRIEERVEQMMAEGLVDEVRSLLANGVPPEAKSLQSLGYRQIVAHLLGQQTLAEAVALIKRDTRRFAKRQLTWFRREKDIMWIDIHECGGIKAVTEKISSYLAGYSVSDENI
jgi:tRNA dimethylallyltransferase